MPRTKQKWRRGRNNPNRQQDNEDGRNKWKGPNKEAASGESGDRPGYVQKAYIKENDQLEEYYKTQGIVEAEEWDQLLVALRQPLPSSFRITGNSKHGQELLRVIKSDYFADLHTLASEDLEQPKCLSWYPGEMAWQMDLDRKKIRHHPELAKLHKFLVAETESGNISRQEAVSMIPPLLMDIQSHHKVLDMCAAPGSKTAQLIEMLHANGQGVTDGVVVANDADNKRCYLMTHQVKRLASPNFMIINHDASQLPNLFLGQGEEKVALRYDRILCDVPCSGDGTMRKNPDVWKKWHPNIAHNLHSLQARILKRGLMALEVGGRLVYSTCSFNPVENEAVVGSILESCEGAVELVDVSSNLPLLKHRNGLKHWKIMSRGGTWFDTPADVPPNMGTQIRPSMFPPKSEDVLSQLPRCIRLVPHDQDTGGFFVAVLHKTTDLPWMRKNKWPKKADPAASNGANNTVSEDANSKKESTNGESTEKDVTSTGKAEAATEEDVKATGKEGAATEDSESGATTTDQEMTEAPSKEESAEDDPTKKRKADEPFDRKFKKQKLFGYKEDPFIYLTEEEKIWPDIKSFFGISDEFSVNQLMVRSAVGKKRNIYFTSKLIKDLCTFNEGHIKFINLGIKVLSRSDSPHSECDFRLAQDGVEVLCPYVMSRRVRLSKDDVITILSNENPYNTKLSDEAQSQLKNLRPGGLVFYYESDGIEKPTTGVVLTGWLGKASSRSFLPRAERSHYMRMFGLELKSKEEQQAAKEANLRTEQSEGTVTVGSNNEENISGETSMDVDTTRETDTAEVKNETETPEIKTETDIKIKIEVPEEISGKPVIDTEMKVKLDEQTENVQVKTEGENVQVKTEASESSKETKEEKQVTS